MNASFEFEFFFHFYTDIKRRQSSSYSLNLFSILYSMLLREVGFLKHLLLLVSVYDSKFGLSLLVVYYWCSDISDLYDARRFIRDHWTILINRSSSAEM